MVGGVGRFVRLRTALSVAGLILVGALVGVGPAAAHDYLVETDPAEGAVLTDSPEALSLTFSAELLEVAPAIILTDSAGTTIVEATPELERAAAVVPLDKPLPDDDYRLAWSVVSSDGHRIQGSYEFTVGAVGSDDMTSPPTMTPTAPADEAAEATAAADDVTAEIDPAAPADAQGLPAWAVVVVALGGLGAVAALVILAVRRSRDGGSAYRGER